MTTNGTRFNVDTRPTKEIVVKGLTRDASVEACLFDLIDNSIDAARNSIFKSETPDNITSATPALPDSYENFSIELFLNGEGCKIVDNCGGISRESLEEMVLRFGQRSSHELGIGIFGVGLNRALFKLGKVTKLSTDTGSERAELVLDVDEYLNESDKWKLPAVSFPSRGKIGTTIEISQLPEDISRQFASKDEVDALTHEIGKRYGNFIDKGLNISLNASEIPNESIKIRKDGVFKGEYKYFKTAEGVFVHVEFGQHQKHRFTAEKDYDLEINRQLTEEYGWTILCNDRAIVLSDRTRKTGWDKKFHTEFYGFVGVVNFICEDASKLPWNTPKTDVDQNNRSYQITLPEMQEFARKWRQISLEAKKIKSKGGEISGLPTAPKSEKNNSKINENKKKKTKDRAKNKNTGTQTTRTLTTKEALNQFRTLLPRNVDEILCSDKQLSLVHEAKSLDLPDHIYSGLALLRILFETSVVNYFIRNGRIEELKQFATDRREANGKKLKVAFKKKLIPKLEEMFLFMDKNPDSWAPNHANYLQQSLKLAASHKQILNGVVHDPYQTVGVMKAMQIRDEMLPVLRHLIEPDAAEKTV